MCHRLVGKVIEDAKEKMLKALCERKDDRWTSYRPLNTQSDRCGSLSATVQPVTKSSTDVTSLRFSVSL